MFLALLLVPITVGAAEVTVGTAEADSILVRLSTALGTVSIGTDDAEATTGTTQRAFARFVSGQAAEQSVGAAEKTTTTKGEQASQTVGEDNMSLGDLASLHVIGAEVATSVGTNVSSSITADLGNVSLMGGLAALDGAGSATTARTGETGSHVTRQVSLAQFRALALADFLAALNVSPLDLTCGAVADLGELLGLDAANCQALLDQVNGLIDDALAALQDAEDDILVVRDAALAALDAAQLALDGLEQDLSDLQTTLGGLTDTLGDVTGQRDTAEAARALLVQTLTDLQNTKVGLDQRKSDLETQVSGYTKPQLQSDRDTVTSCDGLTGIAQTLCEGDLLVNTFPGLAETYGVDLGGLGFDAAHDALLDEIDPLIAAFDELDAVNAQLAVVNGAISDVNDAIAVLDGDISDLNDQISDLNSQINDVNADIATVNDAIDALRDEIDGLNALLDQLLADLGVIGAADPSDTTCTLTSDALESVSDLLPALSATLDPIAADLDAACGDLAALLNGLLDIPLVTVDGVDISIDVFAREDDPYVTVTGTLGTVQVGNLDPIAVDLLVGGDEVPVVQELISSSFAAISAAVGIDLPVPSVTLLATDQDAGQLDDGTWFAEGSITFLRVDLPAGVVTVPDEAPLSPLDGMGDSLVLGAPSGGGAGSLKGLLGASYAQVSPLAAIPTPGLTLDIATFNANGTFKPATAGGCVTNCGGGNGCTSNCGNIGGNGGGGNGGTNGNGGGGGQGSSNSLPRTGVVGFGSLLPALTFGAAEILRRILRRTR